MDKNKQTPWNPENSDELKAFTDFESQPIEESNSVSPQPESNETVEHIETEQTPTTIFLGENGAPLTGELDPLPTDRDGNYQNSEPTHNQKVQAAKQLADSLLQENSSQISPVKGSEIEPPSFTPRESDNSFDSIEAFKERMRQASFDRDNTGFNSPAEQPPKAGIPPKVAPQFHVPTSTPVTFQQEEKESTQQKNTSYSHIPREPSKKGVYLTKKAAAIGTAAILLLSGTFAYIGAGLAGGGAGNPSVVYQDVSEKVRNLSADKSGNLTTAQIAEKNMNSVVEIDLESNDSSSVFGGSIRSGAGSGIIISQDGYIVTNAHVVSGATNIVVRLKNAQEYKATVVGSDTKTDIAVIKIDANDLTPAVLGNSDDLHVGDEAVAIGNPLGKLGGTVTTGIISAVNREVAIDGNNMSLLQTNAAINPGNSGGGLFDGRGNLIGIVNAKSSGTGVEGLGFAIPINEAKDIFTEIIENGYVDGRVQLGVRVLDISSATQAAQQGVEKTGVYIAEIIEGTGAANADLKAGDLILALGETIISDMSDLSTALENYKVKDTVTLRVLRDGETISTQVTLTAQTNNS